MLVEQEYYLQDTHFGTLLEKIYRFVEFSIAVPSENVRLLINFDQLSQLRIGLSLEEKTLLQKTNNNGIERMTYLLVRRQTRSSLPRPPLPTPPRPAPSFALSDYKTRLTRLDYKYLGVNNYWYELSIVFSLLLMFHVI